jgi:hypothetical protein
MRPDVAAWLARARADAEARDLAPLVPLLEALARSTAALRDADIGGPEGPASSESPAGDDSPGGTPDAGDASS